MRYKGNEKMRKELAKMQKAIDAVNTANIFTPRPIAVLVRAYCDGRIK